MYFHRKPKAKELRRNMKGIDCAMVYRCPGEQLIHGVKCESLVIHKSLVDEKLARGWYKTPREAACIEDDNSPPTREEMLIRAMELGIKVDWRWSDKRLLAEIEAIP